jgi:hypothetical protein
MATRAASLSKPDREGQYARQLGWKVNGRGKRVQHKFRLGSDKSAATVREALLRRVWDIVERHAGTQDPVWTNVTLEIANQVAKGADLVRVSTDGANEAPHIYRRRLQILQDRYSFLRLAPTDELRFKQGLTDHELACEGIVLDGLSEALQRRRSAYEATDRLDHPLLPTPDIAVVARSIATARDAFAQPSAATDDGRTLHQALDAYVDWIKEEYRQGDSETISEYGHTKLGQFKTIKERHDDIELAKVNLDHIEAMYRYWRRRPASKAHATKGKPMSLDSVRHYLGELERFFKWLHRSQNFAWRKPDGFDDLDKTVRVDTTEIKSSIRQVNLFQLDELVALNRYATPTERLYLLLGLNCGFGPKETATLTIGECFLHQGLPKDEQELFDFPTTNEQSFISLVRNKTTIVGKYLLFSQTAQMVCWAMQRRLTLPNPAPDQPLILSQSGTALDKRSGAGNPSRLIANAFVRLKKRCEFNSQPVSDLPFKCLRKTAGDLIRRVSDGEVSGVFLLHGSPVERDKLSDVYTNRPFGKVYRAIQEVESYLAPVFNACPNPLEDQPQAYTPRSIIDLIAELHVGGASIREIEAKTSLSKSTIHRHLQKLSAKASSPEGRKER